MKILNSFRHSPATRAHAQRGASMVEYVLLIMLVALIAFPAVGQLGGSVALTLNSATAAVSGSGGVQCAPGSPIWPDCLD